MKSMSHPLGIIRRMVVSWVLGGLVWIVAIVALLSYLTDVYRVLISIRDANTLLGEFLRTIMTSVMYTPLFFVPALIVGGGIGLVMGIVLKERLRAGSLGHVEDTRRFLRILLGAIWVVITLIAIFIVFPEVDRVISSISPPAWVYSLVLIGVTALVLMWIERHFMRWYARQDGEQNVNNPEPVPN